MMKITTISDHTHFHKLITYVRLQLGFLKNLNCMPAKEQNVNMAEKILKYADITVKIIKYMYICIEISEKVCYLF